MRVLCVALLWSLLIANSARAESYEWERTQKLLQSEKLELEPAPEGKRIAYVRIVRDDVFVEDEIWPTWFNLFHWISQDSIVRRELLFAPGDAFADARAEESMRNLRGMGVLALVRIVAVKTARPDEVGVIVHTRDVWSLRLEQDFNITTQINFLLLRLTERNLFGRNKQIGADVTVLPKTNTLGGFYYARRVLGSAFSFKQTAAVFFNRESSHAEGSSLGASFGMPFYSLAQPYTLGLSTGYTTQVARRVENGVIETYQPEPDGPSAQRVWRQKSHSVVLYAGLQRGTNVRHRSETGWDLRSVDASPNRETSLDAGLEDGFYRDVLPKQRTESGPFVAYNFFIPTFKVFTDLGTYGQSENVRLGPSVSASVRAPLSPFGSSTNSVVGSAAAGIVLAPSGGLVDASAAVLGRYEEGELVDQLFSASVRGATPQFGIFRLVARVAVDARKRDTAKSFVTLGGNNGLRGYQSQAINGYGASAAVGNVELRTKPLAWQAVHVGGVLFYDVGTVYETWTQFRPVYAVGVGLRVLFPQFNRYPFSFDAGAPIDPGFRIVPTIQSGQVVSLTSTEDALQN